MKQWFLVLLGFIFTSAFLNVNAQQGTAEWSRRAGSNGTDQANGVVTDASGNVYVTGSFSGSGADFGNGIFRNSSGAEDVFVAKYSSTGATQWVSIAGASGTNLDRGRAVAVDAMGNVIVAGFIEGSANFANTNLTSGGLRDAFVAKYDGNGNLIWAKRMGGVGRDEAYDVATDAAGNIYVSGHFQNSVSFGSTTLTSAGDFDAFTAKLDMNGNPVWATRSGGALSDQSWSLSIDPNSNVVFATGYFEGIAQFDGSNGVIEKTSAGGFDMFVAGFNTTTGKVEWVNTGGGGSSDYGHKVIAERGTGATYVTGRYAGAATFMGANGSKVDLISSNSSDDIYLLKYNSAGELVWGRTAGSTLSDFGNSLALDNGGGVYLAGQFQGSFNWTSGVDPNFNLASKGNYDLFVARYDGNGNVNFVKGFGTSSLDVATGINLFGGAAYVSGYYTGTIKFDNNPSLTAPGLTDVFVARLNFDVQPCNLVTPTISAGAAANCQQTLTATGGGNVSVFNWFRNGVQIFGQNGPSIVAVEAGLYTVQGVQGACVSSVSQSINVSISNNLNVIANASPASVSAGQSSTLSVTVSGNTGATTITWRDSNGNIVGNGASVNVTPSTTTSFTVEVVDVNGCRRTGSVTVNVLGTGNCRTDGDIIISIIPGNDNVPSTANIAEICQGQSTGLQAAGFIGNTNFTYTWIRETTSGNIVVDNDPVVESIVIDGRYRLQVTSPGCPVATSAPIDVKTFQVPTVTVSSNQSGNNCATGSVVLTASATGGTPFTTGGQDIENGYKYRWEPANAVINGNNRTRSVTVNPNIATTFTVTAEDAITCGRTTQITVNPAIPTIQITSGPIQVCTGNSVTLSATLNQNPTANQVIRWYLNGVLQPNLSGSSITIVTGGNWSADIFDRTTNCRNTSNVTSVTFGAQANAFAGNDRTICNGSSTVLGTNSVAGVTYSWAPTDGLSNPFVANPVARPGFTTTYTLTASTANCPSSSSTVTVNVEQQGIAPAIATNDPTSICPGGGVNFFIVDPIQGASYTWFVNGGARTTGNTFTLVSENATVTARMNVNGGGVCANPFSNAIGVSVFDAANLMVPKIQPFGSATLAICNNQSVRMFTERVEGLAYQWWFNGEVIPGANDSEYMATMKGIYHVQVFAGSVGAFCASKKSEGLFITQSNVAPVDVTSEGDRTVCPESNVCLKFHATTGHPSKNIMWSWMPTTAVVQVEKRNDFLELCVKPSQTTTYTVWVKDDFGCIDQVTATVFMKDVAAPVIQEEATLCAGEKVTLVGTQSNNNFYRWYKRTITSANVTNINPTWSEVVRTTPTALNDMLEVTGTVIAGANGFPKEQYVLETSIEGCDMVYSNWFTLTTNANPTVTVSGSGTFCENNVGTRTLTASVSPGQNGGTTTVNWSSANGTPFTVSANGLSITTSPGTSDVFTAMVTNSRGCMASASGTITVVGRVTPLIAGGGAICTGSATELTVLNETPGYSIQWQRATTENGAFSNIPGATNITHAATAAGFYRANFSSICGTFSSTSVEVSVNPVASFEVAAKRASICWGENIELFLRNTVTPSLSNGQVYTFRWLDYRGNLITSNTGTSAVPNVIDFNSVSYPDSNTKAYSYTLEVTHPNGCITTRSVAITLEKLGPNARAYADKPMVCEGTTVMLMGENIGKLSGEMNNFMTLPPNYRYVYYRWNGPATSGNPTGLYDSGILEMNNVAQPGMISNRKIKGLAVRPMETTTYTLTLTTPLNECVATCEVVVQVGKKLVATVQNVTENENLCEGPVTLRAICNSSNPGIMFQWYTDVDGMDHWVPVPGATSQDFMPTTGGNYNVKVWLPGMEACYDYADRFQTITGVINDGAANDVITVMKNGDWMVQDMPVVICAGQQVDLQARYIFGAAYQWYKVTGPKNMPSYELIAGASDRMLRVSQPGNYRVNIIAGCFSCPGSCETWSQTCPVVVLPELKPTVLHNGHIELCDNEHVELYTQGKTSQYNYQWYRADLENNNYVKLTGETNPRLITKMDGRYAVEVTSIFTPVSNADLCREMSVNYVDVKRCIKDYCPAPISVRGILNVDNGSSVVIAWDQPLNGSQYNLTGNYRLMYGVTGTPTSSWTTVTVMGKTMYEATGLTLGTDYTAWVVSLCDGVDKESDPEQGMFRTFGNGVVTCSAPGALSVTQTATQATVTWNAVASAVRYHVSVDGATEVPTTATSFTFDIVAGTTYSVQVRTICANTEDATGTTTTFTAGQPICFPLNQPNAVRFNADATTSATLEVLWDQIADAENNLVGYRVEFTPQNDGNTQFVEVLKSSLTPNEDGRVTLSGLTPNTIYEVCVRPYCAEGVMERQVCNSSSTLEGDPVVGALRPMAVWVVGVSSTDARVSWMPVAGATSYTVNITDMAPMTVTDVLADITGLTPSTTYNVTVTANLTGGGTATDAVSVTTLAAGSPASRAQLSTVMAGGCSNNNQNHIIRIEWPENSANVSEYEITITNIGTGLVINNGSIQGDATGFDIEDSNLANNSAYRISVTSRFIDGDETTLNVVAYTGTCGSGRLANNTVNTNTYSIYPNPTKDAFNVEFNAIEAGNVSLKMVDATGRTVYASTVNTTAGVNTIPVNANVSGGIYMLQIQKGSSVHTAKIVIE